jgi:hypothetical protein
MSGSTQDELSARNSIMMLLTNEENSRVTTAEARGSLSDGSEYLDLEHLDRGIQRVSGADHPEMAHVIPRSAVGNDTWSKIVTHLSS